MFKFLVLSIVLFAATMSDARMKFTRQTHLPRINLLDNPGFESHKAKWTSSGGSFNLDITTELMGSTSAKWNPSAASQTFTSDGFAIPRGLHGQDCELSFILAWDTGTEGEIQFYAWDGTNALHPNIDLLPTASGEVERVRVEFKCPSSGSLYARLESTATADEITVDDFWLGSEAVSGTLDVVDETEGDYLTGCVSRYLFDFDGSDFISGNTGTLTGDAVVVADSIRGNVLQLQGSDDYMQIPYDSSLDPTSGEATWSVWSRSKQFENGRALLYQEDGGTVNKFGIYSGEYFGGVWDSTNGNQQANTSPDVYYFDLDRWTHLLVTFKDDYWRLYRDGVEIANKSTIHGAKSLTTDYFIGVKADLGFDYIGYFDDVRIYNVGLTPVQVLRVYENTRTKFVKTSLVDGKIDESLLPTNKWQKNFLSSAVSSNGAMSDLTYANLEVGMTYKVGGQIHLTVNNGGSDIHVAVNIRHDGVTIGKAECQVNSSLAICGYGVNETFTATTTTLTFEAAGASAGAWVLGNNNGTATNTILMECNECRSTSEWTP